MKKKNFTITAIVVFLALIALAGYLFPPAAQSVPTRVIMDNSGGRVIFNHLVHADEYGLECADCHHDDIELDKPLACGSCHPSEYNQQFRDEHMKAFPNDESCLRCHDDTPSKPMAEEDRPDMESIPTRANAFHSQCMSCHEEMGGPYDSDSCYTCHAR